MKKELKIAVLPGDGIGPEVIDQAIKVLHGISDSFGHTFHFNKALIGADAIEKTGQPLPEDTIKICKEADAVLMGSIGDQQYKKYADKVRPEDGMLGLRKELKLYANIRPIKAYERLYHLSPLKNNRIKGVDLTIIRELTGGIYFGDHGRQENDTFAYDICSYYKHEIERVAHLAFLEARKRRNNVCLVDKANILESSRLWRETVTELHESEYSDVELDYLYVDHAAMQLITNPIRFDVILTSNIFGDILSDAGSVIAGSLGLLPSASIGGEYCLFEPVHGSYPEAVGKDIANPIGTILSAAMLLEYFKMDKEAQSVYDAVDYCMAKSILTNDLEPDVDYTCSQLGDVIQALVAEEEGINIKGLKESNSSII